MANAKVVSDAVVEMVARIAVEKLHLPGETKEALLQEVTKVGVEANFERQLAPEMVSKSLKDKFYPPKDLQLLDIVSAMERVLARHNAPERLDT